MRVVSRGFEASYLWGHLGDLKSQKDAELSVPWIKIVFFFTVLEKTAFFWLRGENKELGNNSNNNNNNLDYIKRL